MLANILSVKRVSPQENLSSQSATPFETVTEDEARAEQGRAQPLTAMVKTTTGWTAIVDLAQGDERLAGEEPARPSAKMVRGRNHLRPRQRCNHRGWPLRQRSQFHP